LDTEAGAVFDSEDANKFNRETSNKHNSNASFNENIPEENLSFDSKHRANNASNASFFDEDECFDDAELLSPKKENNYDSYKLDSQNNINGRHLNPIKISLTKNKKN